MVVIRAHIDMDEADIISGVAEITFVAAKFPF